MLRRDHPVITFYSYKGGTGRTSTLANMAWLLASSGQRVCALDFDLEAPGLHRYFRPFLDDSELAFTDGLLDWLWEVSGAALMPDSAAAGQPSILDYLIQIDWDFSKNGALDFLPAGRQDADYAKRLNSFEWANFYERLGGRNIIDKTRDLLKQNYDFVLIDSRTGVSDTSGICTIQMPDRLVACYTLNRQSIEGVDSVLRSVVEQRAGNPLDIFPVEMRYDTSEKRKLEAARAEARPRFSRYISKDAAQPYWDNMEVQYWPFYNFEECLAVFADLRDNRSPNSMLSAMERITRTVSGIPEVSAPAISPKDRDFVLASYALGNASGKPDSTAEAEPEIFTEVLTRYRTWTEKPSASRLLRGDALARLDAAGPLPGYLRSDAQFMAYLIRSRDRLRTVRRSTWAVSGAGFALAIGGLAASLTLANPGRTILLASSAALAVAAALVTIVAIFSLRQERRSQDK